MKGIRRLLCRWFGCPGLVEGLNQWFEWRCQRCGRLHRRTGAHGEQWARPGTLTDLDLRRRHIGDPPPSMVDPKQDVRDAAKHAAAAERRGGSR